MLLLVGMHLSVYPPSQCLFPFLASYLRCFKFNLYALISKVDLPHLESVPRSVFIPPFGDLKCFRLNQDTVKKVDA